MPLLLVSTYSTWNRESCVTSVFVPFITQNVTFSGLDWVLFEVLSIAIIFVVSIIVIRKQKIKMF